MIKTTNNFRINLPAPVIDPNQQNRLDSVQTTEREQQQDHAREKEKIEYLRNVEEINRCMNDVM